MSRKVFAAGEILTAADSNEFLIDQNVMSFADSTARGSAIGTAVQGMVTYLNDIDSLSIYNGSNWTVDRTIQSFADSTARSSAIGTAVDGMASWLEDSDSFSIYNGSSWQSVGAGESLVLLTSQTFSSVASVSVDSVFSATYASYKIIVNVTSSSANSALRLRLRTGSTDETASVYDTGSYYVGVVISLAAGSDNSVLVNYGNIGALETTTGMGSEIIIHNPQTANKTKYHAIGAGGNLNMQGIVMTVTTSYDGLTLLASTGTMSGKFSIYGIVES